MNILNGLNFGPTKSMLQVMVRKYMQQKKSNDTCAYPVIEKNDLAKLSEYFDRSTPTKLQDEVFFQLCFHFGAPRSSAPLVQLSSCYTLDLLQYYNFHLLEYFHRSFRSFHRSVSFV